MWLSCVLLTEEALTDAREVCCGDSAVADLGVGERDGVGHIAHAALVAEDGRGRSAPEQFSNTGEREAALAPPE